MDMISYGFSPNMLTQYADNSDGLLARVSAVHKERYALVCAHGETFGRLKSSVYFGNTQADFPTTGDFILIQYEQNGDSLILSTLPRKTFFSRRDPTPGRGEQAVAANFDYVFILQSLNQDFNPKRLERYLTLSWQSGAIPVVVLTKADLTEEYDSYVRAAQSTATGVEVCVISAKTGFGIDSLSPYLQSGKTIVFLGSSGVGKSSLLNALAGEELMAVQDIRADDGKGRHTTSHRQLFLLKDGIMLIDTPGMRELGMWNVSSGLDDAFSDVTSYLGSCKFSDCQHQTEPGCAIKKAIAHGSLSQERWESYVSLQNEAVFSVDKTSYLRQKEQKFKGIAQLQRKMQKNDYRHTACTESFTCSVCGALVLPDDAGSEHRNHCPNCLSSIHLDNQPGDRASLCKGIMDPIGVWVRKNGEWALIHRCRSCGVMHSNRIAANDNPALLLSIAVKPLAAPPFPLDKLQQV